VGGWYSIGGTVPKRLKRILKGLREREILKMRVGVGKEKGRLLNLPFYHYLR
jgi:hypothetical protein